jgi:hypothetical protein
VILLRVTKYDPSKRDRQGRYLANDFTSASDVGSVLDGLEVRAIDYIATEDAYVNSIKRLLLISEVKCLCISEFEDWRGKIIVDSEIKRLRPAALDVIYEGLAIQKDDIDRIVRMNLRNEIWCKLSGAKNTYVHFGHDLYMYIGCDVEGVTLGLPPEGLFYEEYESPYA